MRYIIILEESENSFGAYVPDLPGCVAVAETKTEALKLIQETKQDCAKKESLYLNPHLVVSMPKYMLNTLRTGL